MTGRIRRSADFERLLGAAPVCRSAHFSLHYVPKAPNSPSANGAGGLAAELSTEVPETCSHAVDDSDRGRPSERHWLGLIVPKRQLHKATTRNLIRRQAREAFRRHAAGLRPGLWLLRLRQGFDRRAFRSATSEGLGAAARAELDALLSRAASSTPAKAD